MKIRRDLIRNTVKEWTDEYQNLEGVGLYLLVRTLTELADTKESKEYIMQDLSKLCDKAMLVA